ncbi:contractile injection system protein, VgrG/Pvc8 family, partial [Burkholderia glumae]
MATDSKTINPRRRSVSVTSAAIPQVLGHAALEFMAMEGSEELGKLFDYKVLLRTPDDYVIPLAESANLDLRAMLGKELTVSIELDAPAGVQGTAQGAVREITGLVTKSEFVRREGRFNVYRVTLKPWLWLAT